MPEAVITAIRLIKKTLKPPGNVTGIERAAGTFKKN
jgi:hypothetical protein